MTDIKRRKLLGIMGAGAAAIPLSSLVGALPSRANAQDAPMVDPESAQAQALQYVAESTTDGQTCTNCILFQGAADAEAGACALFPGSQVHGAGWCSAWAAKG